MKFLRIFFIALTLMLAVTACGGTVTGGKEELPADDSNSAEELQTDEPDSAEAVQAGETDWAGIYSEILNGQNELGINFMDYSVGDESDISTIRRYTGCGLYDLDGNGIPELFVSIGLWEGGFYHLFTVSDGEGKYIGESMAASVEKSTGILFGTEGESGYTPNIAYEYIDDSLVEIPDYVRIVPKDYSYEVMLGEKVLDWESEDIVWIEMYDSFEDAVTDYNAGAESH